ncbi:hypothetical protein [Halomonas sp. DWK9]|uniref:hypothetical protein n=1 Tax=Halomonas sp. DWK9 TaxID=3060155 RepID=UPI00287F7534|nr:hypothetical protein [Halomonas sp. DWK9]
MDKQANSMKKRSRGLTLCMLAATVSTLALAGCGNGEDEMPPAQQPETLEQDATTTTAPAPENEPAMADPSNDPAMADDPMSSDPGLGEDPAATQEPMPNSAADPEENPGFGEGTDPMPGANDTGAEDATSGDEDDEMTNGQ